MYQNCIILGGQWSFMYSIYYVLLSLVPLFIQIKEFNGLGIWSEVLVDDETFSQIYTNMDSGV